MGTCTGMPPATILPIHWYLYIGLYGNMYRNASCNNSSNTLVPIYRTIWEHVPECLLQQFFQYIGTYLSDYMGTRSGMPPATILPKQWYLFQKIGTCPDRNLNLNKVSTTPDRDSITRTRSRNATNTAGLVSQTPQVLSCVAVRGLIECLRELKGL
jgi:hypothetical protein